MAYFEVGRRRIVAQVVLSGLLALGLVVAAIGGIAPGAEAKRPPRIDLSTTGELNGIGPTSGDLDSAETDPPGDAHSEPGNAAATAWTDRALIARVVDRGKRIQIFVAVPPGHFKNTPTPAPLKRKGLLWFLFPGPSTASQLQSPSSQVTAAASLETTSSAEASGDLEPPLEAPPGPLSSAPLLVPGPSIVVVGQVVGVALTGSPVGALLVWVERNGPTDRLTVRRLGPDGIPQGPLTTIQNGPVRISQIEAVTAVWGEAVIAWTNKLPDRTLGLRVRRFGADGRLGPIQSFHMPDRDTNRPGLAAGSGLFFLTYLTRRPDLAEFGASASISAASSELAAPDEVVIRTSSPKQQDWSAPRLVSDSPGLGNPLVATSGGSAAVFWTNPRHGGRMLDARTIASSGAIAGVWRLRTDLRPDLPTPYRVVHAGDGYWLVAWPQMVGQGDAMVLQARLYYPWGDAAGPPLLVGSASGPLSLLGLATARSGEWIALWQESAGSGGKLRFRLLKKAG